VVAAAGVGVLSDWITAGAAVVELNNYKSKNQIKNHFILLEIDQ